MEDPDDFDLQYADELEMMDEMEDQNESEVNIFPSTPGTSRSMNMTPFRPSSSIDSPLLSQINKNLVDSSLRGGNRFASTPFPGQASTSRNDGHSLQGLGRKRRLDEIFGDIGDIMEEEEPEITNEPYKKVKSEEEKDLELIEMIVSARQKLHSQMLVPGKRTNNEHLDAIRAFKMQNLSYTVPRWPFIKVIHADQDKIYVRCHSEEFETNQLNDLGNRDDNRDGLLGENKTQIWNEASEINTKRMLQQGSTQEDEGHVEVFAGDMHLWVEQYKPRKYIDLLSDESCNKNLLKWIRLWDKVVFGKDVQKHEHSHLKVQQKLNTFNKRTGRFEQTGGWFKKNRWNLNTELDENGRPMQRIALLCGPPGLGKTTLALTVAK